MAATCKVCHGRLVVKRKWYLRLRSIRRIVIRRKRNKGVPRPTHNQNQQQNENRNTLQGKTSRQEENNQI
jgi:hypothetical protein